MIPKVSYTAKTAHMMILVGIIAIGFTCGIYWAVGLICAYHASFVVYSVDQIDRYYRAAAWKLEQHSFIIGSFLLPWSLVAVVIDSRENYTADLWLVYATGTTALVGLLAISLGVLLRESRTFREGLRVVTD